jgi:hypothetical protein
MGAPTKRLIATKQPTIIHAMKKKAASEASLRTGAMSTAVASIPAHMKSSQPSPVEATYSTSIASKTLSKEPHAGLSHCTSRSDWSPPDLSPPPPLRDRRARCVCP